MRKLFFLFIFYSPFCQSQIIDNPSLEGDQGEATSPPAWFGCNPFSTPDTQPGTWMVNGPASDGNTYVSIVTRGRNGSVNDNYTEAIGTQLVEYLIPNTCYHFGIDLAYSASFNDFEPVRQGTWRPIRLNIWASSQLCSKNKLIWKSEVITHENWRLYQFDFTVDQEYSYLILEATYAEEETHNGNILIDNLKLRKDPLQVDDRFLCKGETSTIELNFPNSNILWSDGSRKNTFQVSKAGKYWVEVNQGSCILRDTFTVIHPQKIALNLGDDVTKCLGDEVILDATTENGRYFWSTGSTDSRIFVSESGIYKVQLDNGCEQVEDEIEILFEEQCCTVRAPNVFTPNNDQLNDVFKIYSGTTIGKCRLEIFNRWGKLVYQTNNINEFWTGRLSDGKEATTGVYYWHIEVICVRNNQITENSSNGIITLLR